MKDTNEVTIQGVTPQPDTTTVDQYLTKFSQYGRPRLCMLQDGSWVCVIDIFVTGAGTSLEVRSNFNKNSSFIQACRDCNDNLTAALNSLRALK